MTDNKKEPIKNDLPCFYLTLKNQEKTLQNKLNTKKGEDGTNSTNNKKAKNNNNKRDKDKELTN